MASGVSELPGKRPWRGNPGSEIQLALRVKLAWILCVWAPCFLYAIVRYNVFGDVAWIHLPLYVVNKSFAFSGIILLACSYLTGKLLPVLGDEARARRAQAKFCGLAGYAFISMHVVMSFLLLSPQYYEKFFHESGRLNFTGELTLLFGVLGLACFSAPAITTLPYMFESLGAHRWLRAQRMGYVGLAMAVGHTLTMGYSGWLAPSSWPGGLPPITMIGCLAALIPLAVKLYWSRNGRSSPLVREKCGATAEAATR